VEKNCRLGLEIRKFYGPDGKHSPRGVRQDEKEEQERVDHWLHWLGIDHLKTMFPSQLSRGQRQRAAIARTLVLQPDLLLMDEPFSALDAPIREELQRVMNSFHQDTGLTSLTVTHDIEEAVVLGEKILVLANGCNRNVVVIENQLSGMLYSRNSPDFISRCRELKTILVSDKQNISSDIGEVQ
jgi:NitT/TauT family transport system ATP-binding protein